MTRHAIIECGVIEKIEDDHKWFIVQGHEFSHGIKYQQEWSPFSSLLYERDMALKY